MARWMLLLACSVRMNGKIGTGWAIQLYPIGFCDTTRMSHKSVFLQSRTLRICWENNNRCDFVLSMVAGGLTESGSFSDVVFEHFP